MKFLLSLLFIITFSNAESIYNGKCVDYFYTLNSSTLKIKYSSKSTESTMTESKSKIQELRNNTNKFYYDSDTNTCIAYMLDENHTLMMSLSGLVCGLLLSSTILYKVS